MPSDTDILAEIVDMRGKTVWLHTFRSHDTVMQETIDLQERLAEGTYLVRVRANGQQLSKLVIVR
jgi:hypothetical protein